MRSTRTRSRPKRAQRPEGLFGVNSVLPSFIKELMRFLIARQGREHRGIRVVREVRGSAKVKVFVVPYGFSGLPTPVQRKFERNQRVRDAINTSSLAWAKNGRKLPPVA